MEDYRIPIPSGTELTGFNGHKQVVFCVQELIGRGGSCMAYHAYYVDTYGIRHDCILKQLFPLHPDNTNEICWDAVPVSESELKRFLKASTVQEQIVKDSASSNAAPSIRSVFSYKNSIYFQCLEQNSGVSLDRMYFDTLYEYLGVLIRIAEIVSVYHEKGWLHLDIKPQNIFCKNSVMGISVVMIDFDSLIYTEDIPNTSIRLSYSEDYAPPELQKGERHKISIQSDFYEIGCILFRKLFGRSPRSTEITGFSRYRFQESILERNAPKELIDALQDFFRHTLTVTPASRYSDDAALLAALQRIRQFSKERTYRIISNFTTPSVFFIGRHKEMEHIHRFLQDNGKIIIQGVGGIGKSSVALRYAERYCSSYQSIIYLEYHGSFEELIEHEIQISELPVTASIQEKWEAFKSLCNNKVLVILDNLDHAEYPELAAEWLDLPCHLIVTSRSSRLQYQNITFPLPSLEEAKELFCHYYTHTLSEEDDALVNRLLYTIGCHTMMTELIGKFCNHSMKKYGNANLRSLLNAFENADTAGIAQDNVKQLKDWMPSSRSIQKHMDVLFNIFAFQPSEKYILQFLSLLPLKSVSDKLLASWCKEPDMEALENLKNSGLIQTETDGYYKLHSLTAERILCNYPPDAKVFSYTTEKIIDAITANNRDTLAVLLKIGAFYIAHLQGANRSLAFLCLTLAANTHSEQANMYTKKAVELYHSIENGEIPAYFILKPLIDRYLSFDWFDDCDQKEKNINEIMRFLEYSLEHMPEYRTSVQSEQIAGLCRHITDQEILWLFDDGDHPIYQYEEKFLEMAMHYCQSPTERKRIAARLFEFYGNYMNPLHNCVKETSYRYIAGLDDARYVPQVWIENPETKEKTKIDSEMFRDGDLIEALMIEKRYEEALALADPWYAKWENSSICLESYLHFIMTQLYWEVDQWEKYIPLTEAENRFVENHMEWKLVEAYYRSGEPEKCYTYLKAAETYYAPLFCTALDIDTIKYLISLLCLAEYFPQKEPDAADRFLSSAEIFYHNSLLAKDDELADFCLRMTRSFLEAGDAETAGWFLGLYARFQESLHVDEKDYKYFQQIMDRAKISGYGAIWCSLLTAEVMDRNMHTEEALHICEQILLECDGDEQYMQLIYRMIGRIDHEYLAEHFADRIDYMLLNEIELQTRRKPLEFDELIRRKIDAAVQYRNTKPQRTEEIMKQILSEIRTFSGDVEVKSQVLHYIEHEYAQSNDIDQALQLAKERFDLYRDEIPSKKAVKICVDIAGYYQKQHNFAQQVEWLKKALAVPEKADSERMEMSGVLIEAHEKLIAYYEMMNDELMQIQEYQQLEVLLCFGDRSENIQHLQKVYHSLSDLFFRQCNPTQAYFYSVLEEEIVQERILNNPLVS